MDELVRAESIRLFLERALGSQPTFTLTDANAPAVAQVCRQLEGNPLAIELAAARARVLSPEQIAARLTDRFKLLTGGSRTAPPRQQSLRATMDWGYGLLSEPERVLLQRLSVFEGAFTLGAATAVCADVTSPSIDVPELLGALESKSFAATEDGGTRRYRLLDAVRQYGGEKLLQSGEAPAVRQRYQNWSHDVVSHA